MPTDLSHLRWELLSGKRRKEPDTNHEESWLVANWPDYVERTFEKAPNHMMHQLRKMAEDKKTPKVEAHKVRGQTVKPIDSRPLGDLEFAKLEKLLLIYEEKLKAWWEAKNAGQVGQSAIKRKAEEWSWAKQDAL